MHRIQLNQPLGIKATKQPLRARKVYSAAACLATSGNHGPEQPNMPAMRLTKALTSAKADSDAGFEKSFYAQNRMHSYRALCTTRFIQALAREQS